MNNQAALQKKIIPVKSLTDRYMMICNSKCAGCFRKNVANLSCEVTTNKEFGKCWVRGVLDTIEAKVGTEVIMERLTEEMSKQAAI